MTTKEQVNELLIPRARVDMDYPNNSMPVGTILTMTDNDCYKGCGLIYHKSMLDKHPKIFRALEWWEHRKPEEMPKYVKPQKALQYVFNVIEYKNNKVYFINGDGGRSSQGLSVMLPATLEEYTTYINSK